MNAVRLPSIYLVAQRQEDGWSYEKQSMEELFAQIWRNQTDAQVCTAMHRYAEYKKQSKAKCPNLEVGSLDLSVIYPPDEITRVKRFEGFKLKCKQDNALPESSASSSHLPSPGLLQKVSLVNFEPKDLEEEWEI